MNPVETAVRQWLHRVVVGLSLCPFAAGPIRDGRLRIVVSAATSEQALLTDLELELRFLDETPVAQLETTLIAIPEWLADFADFNEFLGPVEALLDAFGWTGYYQIASFHPNYQFADTRPGDPDNLTNCSPYPLLHLLRESSVEAARVQDPDTDRIPIENVVKMRALTLAQRLELFAYRAPETIR